MALKDTVHRLTVALSDVDRGVYETVDLRLARHPSESARYLWTRTIAYCLELEEGIAFSKGGLSATDEPPVSVHDPTGILLAWIDVGSPSAERLHRASKAARRVALYSHAPLAQLRKEASSRPVHRLDHIALWRVETTLLDALEEHLDKSISLELVRTEGQLYVTVAGRSLSGSLERASLVEA